MYQIPRVLTKLIEQSSDVDSYSINKGEVVPQNKILMYEILLRAIKDLNFILDENPEHRAYARNSLAWIFIENEKSSTRELQGKELKLARDTSCASICNWLDIDINYLRSLLIDKFDIGFMDIFSDG